MYMQYEIQMTIKANSPRRTNKRKKIRLMEEKKQMRCCKRSKQWPSQTNNPYCANVPKPTRRVSSQLTALTFQDCQSLSHILQTSFVLHLLGLRLGLRKRRARHLTSLLQLASHNLAQYLINLTLNLLVHI